jgi:hypothetical protein
MRRLYHRQRICSLNNDTHEVISQGDKHCGARLRTVRVTDKPVSCLVLVAPGAQDDEYVARDRASNEATYPSALHFEN